MKKNLYTLTVLAACMLTATSIMGKKGVAAYLKQYKKAFKIRGGAPDKNIKTEDDTAYTVHRIIYNDTNSPINVRLYFKFERARARTMGEEYLMQTIPAKGHHQFVIDGKNTAGENTWKVKKVTRIIVNDEVELKPIFKKGVSSIYN